MSSDSPEPAGAARSEPGPAAAADRELTDPWTIRAVTHPVRLALLEALLLEGPLTATRAGELIGEPPNTCSFHLRQLAKYGFVEEAGGGPGRARPWRLTSVGMHFGESDDPAARLAAQGLSRLLRERYLARVQEFYEGRGDQPREWREVSGGREFILHATPEELRAVHAEITAVIDRYRGRLTDPALRPAGSLPVEVLLFSYPMRSPGR